MPGQDRPALPPGSVMAPITREHWGILDFLRSRKSHEQQPGEIPPTHPPLKPGEAVETLLLLGKSRGKGGPRGHLHEQ